MSLYKERKKWLKEQRFQEGKIVERGRDSLAERGEFELSGDFISGQ